MKSPCPVLGALAVWLIVASGVALAADAETVGQVMTLPERPGPHWFWLSDILLHRTALFDADTGGLLGQISSGTAGVGFVIAPLFSPDHREIYLAETYYARGVRGKRTDVVTVYDAATLQPLGDEIEIPAERAEYFPGTAANALSDDGRFMAVFNLTPRTSVSIVDVNARRSTAHVDTPGCSLVYAAGARRFLMLCANGAALSVMLDDEGGEARLERSEPFFDPQKDPVTEKAVRRGNEWLFVSFEGGVHSVDVSGEKPSFGETWSLVDDEDRRASWRIGGSQHLAVHAASRPSNGPRHRRHAADGARAPLLRRRGPQAARSRPLPGDARRVSPAASGARAARRGPRGRGGGGRGRRAPRAGRAGNGPRLRRDPPPRLRRGGRDQPGARPPGHRLRLRGARRTPPDQRRAGGAQRRARGAGARRAVPRAPARAPLGGRAHGGGGDRGARGLLRLARPDDRFRARAGPPPR